jgi:uncharacterized protein
MRALPTTPALLAAGLLAGCVSLKRTPEARFFTLRPVAEPPRAPEAESGAGIVGVLPVFLPGSLERPQIVTWSGPGEVRIDEFLRWAEPLDSAVERVLAEDLGVLLPAYRVIKAPWPAATPLRCRVRLEVVQFGSQPGGAISLTGRYVLLPARSERALASRTVDVRREGAGADPGRAVEAMSALMADLAGRIADAIAALPPEAAAKTPAAGAAR